MTEDEDGIADFRPGPVASVVGGVLTLDLLSSWRYALALFSGSSSPELQVVVAAFFVLLLASITGLFKGKTWGFYGTYAFLIASTFLLGDSAIPWITKLLPRGDVAIAGMTAANGVLMGATAWAHSRHRRGLVHETRDQQLVGEGPIASPLEQGERVGRRASTSENAIRNDAVNGETTRTGRPLPRIR